MGEYLHVASPYRSWWARLDGRALDGKRRHSAPKDADAFRWMRRVAVAYRWAPCYAPNRWSGAAAPMTGRRPAVGG